MSDPKCFPKTVIEYYEWFCLEIKFSIFYEDCRCKNPSNIKKFVPYSLYLFIIKFIIDNVKIDEVSVYLFFVIKMIVENLTQA